MGHSTSDNSTSAFCDQVSTVTSLFEKWNDCERTVVLYSLLKRLRYPSLKFLQYSIDFNLTQNFNSFDSMSCSQSKMNNIIIDDINANSPSYLNNLLNTYKAFETATDEDMVSALSSSTDKKSIYFESDFLIAHNSNKNRNNCDRKKSIQMNNSKKEEILNDVLNMLPLLKPGNDDAKQFYLSIIPMAVKDTRKKIVSTELVQQIFSYLLIHPAISSDERKSLSIWLKELENNLKLLHANKEQNQNYYGVSSSNNHVKSKSQEQQFKISTSLSEQSIGNGMTSSAISKTTTTDNSVGSSHNASWQAIAPPTQPAHSYRQYQQFVTSDNLQPNQNLCRDWISDKFCDNLNGMEINELVSSQNSLGLNFTASNTTNNGSSTQAQIPVGSGCDFGLVDTVTDNNMNGNDDHHTSFSKNGTELDYDPNSCDITKIHQIGFSAMLGDCDQFDLNRWSLDCHLAAMKTRRSNSLTTATISSDASSSSSSSSSHSSVAAVNGNCSNSSENLAQYAQKPRSFSLSIEHQRGSLTSSGSETRLDDFKPNYLKFTSPNIGMSNIGQWLKSLRLHKYIDIFKDMTYEDMLEISEDYLQSLGVTKGASHKLALCINKLKDRINLLTKIESDLITGQIKLLNAIEDLSNIVLTPMKAIEVVENETDNVALKFLKVLDLVCSMLQKDGYCVQEDENITIVLWILERSIHNEVFNSHVHQLKEQKFQLSKLKMSIVPKSHNKNNGNVCKPRWNGKSRKTDSKNGSNDRINRKNSGDAMNMPLLPQQQIQSQQQQHLGGVDYENFHQINDGQQLSTTNRTSQYKSSSYPNFMNTNSSQHIKMNHQRQHQQSQQSYNMPPPQHKNSNAFPALTQTHQQVSLQPTPQQLQQHRHSLNSIFLMPNGSQQLHNGTFNINPGLLSGVISSSADRLNPDTNNNHRKFSLTNGGGPIVRGVSPLHQTNNVELPPPPPPVAASGNSIRTSLVSNGSSGSTSNGLVLNNSNSKSNHNKINDSNISNNIESSSNDVKDGVVDSTNGKSSSTSKNTCSQLTSSSTIMCSNATVNDRNLMSNNGSEAKSANNVYNNHNYYNSSTISESDSCSSMTNLFSNSIYGSSFSIMKKDKCHNSSSSNNSINDIKSLEQLEFLCLQMTEQAIN